MLWILFSFAPFPKREMRVRDYGVTDPRQTETFYRDNRHRDCPT
jgi:hypothetical protein